MPNAGHSEFAISPTNQSSRQSLNTINLLFLERARYSMNVESSMQSLPTNVSATTESRSQIAVFCTLDRGLRNSSYML